MVHRPSVAPMAVGGTYYVDVVEFEAFGAVRGHEADGSGGAASRIFFYHHVVFGDEIEVGKQIGKAILAVAKNERFDLLKKSRELLELLRPLLVGDQVANKSGFARDCLE